MKLIQEKKQFPGQNVLEKNMKVLIFTMFNRGKFTFRISGLFSETEVQEVRIFITFYGGKLFFLYYVIFLRRVSGVQSYSRSPI